MKAGGVSTHSTYLQSPLCPAIAARSKASLGKAATHLFLAVTETQLRPSG
ncbi:hypothetical protein Spa11_33120 [Botrimarina mediterranea]|uniref:Uncharacterized protein n=1 Tax=Botrimarina mediterranea TaxID=2528022 RepID=A0A518KBE0_9BACT|nr:hypothetical protein Spa11_33120 [Botrimarina mediterranea]